MQKTAAKNTKYSRNETILKIGHLGKAIDFAKWLVWVKNSNGQKRAKKDSTSTLELFCGKNRCIKHQIFEKWDHFENRPSCKSYWLCKMVSLGQKVKWPKTCEKRFYKLVRVVLCKKPLEEKPYIREMRPFWKSAILQRVLTLQNGQFGSKIQMAKNVPKKILQARYSCSVQKTASRHTKYSRYETILKIGHLAKAIEFAKWSVWVKKSKGQKRAKNDSTSTLELICAKNRLKKHQIFEKWDHFENRPSWKGYRFCKLVSLGQKFK